MGRQSRPNDLRVGQRWPKGRMLWVDKILSSKKLACLRQSEATWLQVWKPLSTRPDMSGQHVKIIKSKAHNDKLFVNTIYFLLSQTACWARPHVKGHLSQRLTMCGVYSKTTTKGWPCNRQRPRQRPLHALFSTIPLCSFKRRKNSNYLEDAPGWHKCKPLLWVLIALCFHSAEFVKIAVMSSTQHKPAILTLCDGCRPPPGNLKVTSWENVACEPPPEWVGKSLQTSFYRSNPPSWISQPL